MSRFSIGFPVSSVGSRFLQLHAVKDAFSTKAQRVGVRRSISDACRGRGWEGGVLYKPFWAEASAVCSSHVVPRTLFCVQHRTSTPRLGSFCLGVIPGQSDTEVSGRQGPRHSLMIPLGPGL